MVLSLERVLGGRYTPANRPYSQNELQEMRERNLVRLGIGNSMACHDCGQCYFAKANGKKEERINSGEEGDIGSCSVCWKLKKMPSDGTEVNFRRLSEELVDAYLCCFAKKPERWTHYMVYLEQVYYKWLYLNFPECANERESYNNNSRQRRPRRNYRDNESNEANFNSPREFAFENNNDDFPALH